MGRRYPRHPLFAAFTVAVLAWSLLGIHPAPPASAASPDAALSGFEHPSTGHRASEIGNLRTGPAEKVDPRAEYPSSDLPRPRPLESGTGPEPLLSNVITGHGFDYA